jgi:glycosyltransferase involved in cell wall biosynthesis
MRLCLVSREFAPFQGWGAGTYASLMAKACADAGHEVHVLTSDPETIAQGPRLRPGVRFHEVDMTHQLAELPAYCCHPQRYAYAVYLSLKTIHGKHRFEAIEFPDFLGEGYFAIRAKRTLGEFADAVLGVRTHMTFRHIRELNQDDWLGVDRAVIDHMETWSILHADAIMAPSAAMLALLEAKHGRLDRPGRPARVVHLPFPEETVRELQPKSRSEPATPTVLFAGRFERRKGVHVLAQACRELWSDGLDFRLRMVGEDTSTGPLCTSMRQHMRTLIGPRFQERMVFEPRADRAEMGRLYAGNTLVCLPSVWENFPFACLEALACGAAFVGSDAGGMAEIIQPGVSGLLAKGGCVRSLAERLRLGLGDAALRGRCAAAGPARIRALCEPSAVVREATAIFEQARERPRSSPQPSLAQPPLVSVIIPVYNSHDFLGEAIASVREQTHKNWEILVVDDGSDRPETVAAIDALAQRPDPRLRVVRIEHAGPSAARNAGLAAARGEFIVPLDSDDMLDARALELYLDAKRRNPGCAYVSSFLLHFRETPAAPHAGWIPLGGDREMLGVVNAGTHSTILIERSLLQELGGYDESMPSYEDWDLACRIASRGLAGEVVPMYLVRYRIRPDSTMQTMDRSRHEMLRARLLSRHAGLSPDPNRTMRFLLGDSVDILSPGMELSSASEDPRVYRVASKMLRENIRYRIADRVNDTLKRLGMQRTMKAALRRMQHNR